MKILYDHQIFALQNYGGISRYFCELMDQFSDISDINYTLALCATYNENLCSRPSLYAHWSDRIPLISCNQIIPRIQKILHINIQKRLYNNQNESVRLLKKQDFDIFHPTYYDPYFLKYLRGKPYVLTVYDMIHELYPEYYSSQDPTRQWKIELIEHADAIIAISKNTKKDILTFTNTEPDRISVVYLGNPFEFHKRNEKITIPYDPLLSEKSYLLFVGDRIRYKNFIFFITTIAKLIKKNSSLHVCCAGGGPFTDNELKILNELGICSNVHAIDTDDHILPQLYMNARAFVFPSLYEGFGLPVLEAFSCGCPAVLSNAGSLPEIGGDAACYFDPQDPVSLIQVLEPLIMEDKLRTDYIRKGRERVSEFSWKKTAEETKKVYQNVLNRS